MAEKKKAFYMLHSWYAFFKNLNEHQRSELIMAIFEHEISGGETSVQLSAELMPIYEFIAQSLDNFRAEYENRCELAKANGRLGGLAKASGRYQLLPSASESYQTLAKASDPNRPLANLADKDKDKVKDEDEDKDWDGEKDKNKSASAFDFDLPFPTAAEKEAEKEIMSYYHKVTGKSKRINESTSICIRRWLAEGYSVSDFKRVIDNMYTAWKGKVYETGLRPEKLFGSSFEQYLDWHISETDFKAETDNADSDGFVYDVKELEQHVLRNVVKADD